MRFRMPHLAMSILRIASYLLFCKFYLGPNALDGPTDNEGYVW